MLSRSTFVMYQHARMSCLLASFQQRVDEGIYPALLPEDTDLGLLVEEEEWTLVFAFLLRAEEVC